MKTVIKGALALVLLASSAQTAFAQDNGDHRRGNRDDGGYNPSVRASTRNVPPSLQQPAPQPQAQTPQAPQAQAQTSQGGGRRDGGWQSRQQGQQAQQPSQGGQRWNSQGGGRPGSWQGQQNNSQGQWNNNDRDRDGRNDRDDRHDRDGRNSGWNGSSNNWNNGSNNHGWNNNGRDWRPDRNQQRPRFDRQHYGHNYRSQQRYRGYAYRPPSGFYIRSWSYGDLLPRSWWSSQYRLNDWWSYGLPIPPIGYEYVRVGDDVLLVDMFSGRVVQVIYDVFW